MNKPLHIRPADKSDAAALATLAGELGYPATAADMKVRIEELISRSDHGVYVADLDSVVGWIHVSSVQSLESDPFAEIRGLVVAPSHRRLGIGGKLVAMAEWWAQQKGCRRIRVRTNVVRGDAKAFYQRLGYRSAKTQEVFDRFLGIPGSQQYTVAAPDPHG